MIGGCSTLGSRGAAAGTDYFEQDFACETGPVSSETNPMFPILSQQFRKDFFQNQERATIVVTGDSTAALFPSSSLQDKLPHGTTVAGRGIPGDTSQLFIDRLAMDVSSLHPRYVILAIGGNDLLGGRCIRRIQQNVENILDRLQDENPGVKIFLTSIPPTNSWKANSVSPYLNSLYRDMAEERRNVEYMDLWKIIGRSNPPGLDPEYNLIGLNGKVDSVHFNGKGYDRWIDLIIQSLPH